MSEKPGSEESVVEEFRKLGQTLASALQAAWEAPERKRLQEELTNGLNDLGATLSHEIEVLSASSTGQQIRANVEQVGEKISGSEVTAKIRSHLIRALQIASSELESAIESWSTRATDSENAGVTSSSTEKPTDKGDSL